MEPSVSNDGPCTFEVIGEHVREPHRLLAIDSDRQLFDFDLTTGVPVPTMLTDDWIVDLVACRETRQKLSPVLVIG